MDFQVLSAFWSGRAGPCCEGHPCLSRVFVLLDFIFNTVCNGENCFESRPAKFSGQPPGCTNTFASMSAQKYHMLMLWPVGSMVGSVLGALGMTIPGTLEYPKPYGPGELKMSLSF